MTAPVNLLSYNNRRSFSSVAHGLDEFTRGGSKLRGMMLVRQVKMGQILKYDSVVPKSVKRLRIWPRKGGCFKQSHPINARRSIRASVPVPNFLSRSQQAQARETCGPLKWCHVEIHDNRRILMNTAKGTTETRANASVGTCGVEA